MNELELEIDLSVIKPKMYRVILHNDDYSTFDFVVRVLVKIFHKSTDEAARITMEVDEKGAAIVGIYPKDIAETKVSMVTEMARQENFPLKASCEEDL